MISYRNSLQTHQVLLVLSIAISLAAAQNPKTLDSLRAAVALHFAYYNFVRIHRALRVTPAMEAGITKRPWSIGDLLAEV